MLKPDILTIFKVPKDCFWKYQERLAKEFSLLELLRQDSVSTAVAQVSSQLFCDLS